MTIDFEGTRYYLDKTTGYYRSHMRSQNREYLHRDVWKHYKGEIPPDHEIHHVVDDRATVNPDHLQLVSFREHLGIHVETSRQNGRNNHHFVLIKDTFTCEGCGIEYRATRRGWNRWCSKQCANRYWNARARKS